MSSRRAFFRTLIGAAVALPFLTGFAAAAARPYRGIYLLDGWVLTARDMEALAEDDR